MKAVIRAGGMGTRISEESQLRPKPMIEIGHRPILWHIMKIYSHYGIDDFIVCLGVCSNLSRDRPSNPPGRASVNRDASHKAARLVREGVYSGRPAIGFACWDWP